MSLSIIPLSSMFTIMCFITQRHHLLMALLSLESIILTLIMLMIYMTSSLSLNNSSLILIMLTFGACEASLGLACLVMMSRSYGNDMINSLTINKC